MPRHALVILLLAFATHAQPDALDRSVDLHIAPQRLSSALIELSKQAGVQVLMPGNDLDDYQTRGLHGHMPLRDALQALLQETPARFRHTGTSTITVDVDATP